MREETDLKRLLYFVSNSKNKYEELKQMAEGTSYDIRWYQYSIKELQTDKVEELLRHKALAAFKKIKRPVIVDNTILEVEAFNNLPGLQTNYFFEKLGNKEIVDSCNYKKKWKAKAITKLCCCTGKKLIFAEGMENGRITEKADELEGAYAWDSIFKPSENNDKDEIYARLDKNERSMRRKAWEELTKQLEKEEILSPDLESYQNNIKDLARLINQKKVMLFIGAGISASIGLPSWNSLIGELGQADDYDPDVFSEYGDNMLLAEYSDGKGGKLQDIFKNKWDINKNPDLKKHLEESMIYKYIMELDCPVIYTTNYDHMLEEYYKLKKRKLHKIVKLNHFNSDEHNYPRIMKFHGDTEDMESIVLTESQYFKRMDYQSFMDIQLQADLLKYTVLFLGYSLADINIKQLLYLSRKRWENTKLENPSYIYTATPNYVQEEVFRNNHIVSISGDEADKKKATEIFLKDLCEAITKEKKRS